jgi:hypothetical protein
MNKVKSLVFGLFLSIALLFIVFFYVGISDLIAVVLVMIIYVALNNRLKLNGRYFWTGSLIGTAGIEIYVLWLVMQIDPSYFENNVYVGIVSIIPAIVITALLLVYYGRRKKEIQMGPTEEAAPSGQAQPS